MLGMAFFKSLVKEHGKAVLRADRQGAAAAPASKTFNPLNPRPPVAAAAASCGRTRKWKLGQKFAGRDRQTRRRAWTRAWPSTSISPWTASAGCRTEISGDDASSTSSSSPTASAAWPSCRSACRTRS